MRAARFISFWTGFCSLSLEIAWVRLFGYANLSTPKAFGFVLTIYLLGIAIGAQYGKRVCRTRDKAGIERMAVYLLMGSAVIAVLSPWAYMWSLPFVLDEPVVTLGIFLTAASLSTLFPITHHLGTRDGVVGGQIQSHKGRHFSRVYMLNVLGAATGPLVTGYVLLEHQSMTQVFGTLAVLLLVVAIVAILLFRTVKERPIVFGGVLATLAVSLLAWQGVRDPHAFAKSLANFDQSKLDRVVENRQGVIAMARSEEYPENAPPFVDYAVYGGNVYDGKANVSLERNTNGLERPLALHVLQPNAQRVLVIGLSIGSWLTVVEGFPGIEAIDVIEINPGYLRLAAAHEAQARALKDPRVNLVIDDARRWLQYHPDKKYDLILMNTTLHWRANSSMLLSQEMMRLVNRHLSAHGVVAFNATGSVDAFYTASTVFNEVRRYESFVYGANWDPFQRASTPIAWEVLKSVTVNGEPGFREGSQKIHEFSQIPFVHLAHDLKRLDRDPELITDDNMLVEYKYGRKF